MTIIVCLARFFRILFFAGFYCREAVSGKDKDNTNFQRVKECLEMAGLMEKDFDIGRWCL